MPSNPAKLSVPRDLRVRLALGTAMASLVLVSYSGRNAMAGDCTPLAGTDILCSGAADAGGNDTTQSLSGDGGAVTITTADGFGIDTSTAGGDALSIKADGGLTFDDTNEDGSAITGAEYGIGAINIGGGDLNITANGPVTGVGKSGIGVTNIGGGDLTITTNGPVTGVGKYGIAATNQPGTSDLTISAAAVTGGGGLGITAFNLGNGALSITATGPVTGAADNGGIFAYNLYTDLTIHAAAVSGGDGGIYASNLGSGDLRVTTTGTVTGGSGDGVEALNYNGGSLYITASEKVSSTSGHYGIFAKNNASTENLTISAGVVSGDFFGVYARNLGSGTTHVTATGTVTGGSGDGINVGGSGTDLTVTAADVSGGDSGIRVDHTGTGDLLVTVTGTVTGGTGAGITNVDSNAQGGTIVVTDAASAGAASGIAIEDGEGATTVTSRGDIAGDIAMNGGADRVRLIGGSATGLLDTGEGDDAIEIHGGLSTELGAEWDDADFDGMFDNNLGVAPDLTGSGGTDTLELFGVTAASAALGTPTEFEALALSTGTVLQANNADLTPFGALFIDGTSTLQAEGNSPSDTTVGPTGNLGTIDLADGEANDSLTVAGDFAGGTGSQLLVDLDSDASLSDSFIVDGDVTDVAAGPFSVAHDRTIVRVNWIGDGDRTSGDGVRLIEVSGDVDEDDFVLSDDAINGIFDYDLVFEDGGFSLQSDGFLDQAFVYESLPGAMQTIGLALSSQLVERVGVRSAVPSTLTDAAGNPVPGGGPVDTAIWGRAVGLSLDSEGDLESTTGGNFEQTIGFVQAGVDLAVLRRDSGRLIIGALGHWGTSSLDVNGADNAARGSADLDFYGGGLTATWYSAGGWYFDNVFQYTAYDVDITTATRFSQVSTDGYGISTSHELGYRIPISATATLVPQAQITYQRIDFDDFIDPDGVRVSLDDGDSLVGRLGLAFENSAAIGSALVTGYAEANVLHEFLGDNSVNATAGGDRFALNQDLGGTSVEVGFGGTVAVSRGVSLYGEIDYTIPFDNGVQGFQALAGVRVNLNPVAAPPPAPVIAPVAETGFIVFFDWDRADLTPEANLVLDDVVVTANQGGYASVRLDGYTDLSGSAAYNLGLSERRANSVADGLIARGVAPDEIVIRAFGEENPLVPTPDGVREPQNRRVEIFMS